MSYIYNNNTSNIYIYIQYIISPAHHSRPCPSTSVFNAEGLHEDLARR